MKKKIENNAKMKYLSEKMRILRLQNGLTQKQLAKIMKSSPQSISCYESGSVIPDISYLYTFAAYFKVSMDEMLNLGDEHKMGAGTTTTSSEMQMVQAYRRRPDWMRRIIRELCFNGSSFRPLEDELKDIEGYLEDQKKKLSAETEKKK